MLHCKWFFVTTITLFLFFSVSSASVIVEPGTTSDKLQAVACAGLTDGPFGSCSGDCDYDCVLSENTAEAYLRIGTTDAGKSLVKSTVYTEFTVSQSPTYQDGAVTGKLIYDIGWSGAWFITSIILDNSPHAQVSLWIRNETTGQIMQTLKLHEIDNNTVASLPVKDVGVDLGAGIDNGSNQGELNLNLERGTTYRVFLSITLEATAFENSDLTIKYLPSAGGSRGVWWNDLKVRIDPDLAEQIAFLTKRVDSLEIECRNLRNGLETHTHTYLTGKGIGQNNTEATTSTAILMDSAIVDEGQLEWLSEDEQNKETMPEKSIVLSNYPNPFNPTTRLEYHIPKSGIVNVSIYNTLGQKVQTIVNKYQVAGSYQIEFNAEELASGIYYYRLTIGNQSETRKLTLLK